MKASKKLIGASAALIAALAVSVGSTYAWFTTSNSVTVGQIEAQVTTGSSSLEVRQVNKEGGAVGAQGWTYNLSEIQIDTERLEALTAEDNGKTLKKLNSSGDGTESNTITTNYVEFYLQFRTLGETPFKLQLGENGSSIEAGTDGEKSPIKYWASTTSDYGTSVTEGEPIAASAANATRAAFIPVTEFGVSPTLGTSKGVWCPNEDQPDGSESSSGSTTNGKGYWKGNLAKDYATHMSYETSIYTNPAYTALEKGGDITDQSAAGDSDLEGYQVLSICVRVWIEGTDGDCFNNIFDDKITISLTFQSAEVV